MKKNNKNVPDPPSSAPVADVEVLDAADEDSSLDSLEELDEDSLDQGEILDVGDDGPMLLTEGSHDESSLPAPSMPRLPSTGGRDSLQLYLREVSRFPMLKPEEEHELAVRVRDHNDPDAAMLSERLGVSEEQITEMDQRLAANDLSLNAQVGEDAGGATRMDFLPALGPGIEDSLGDSEVAELLREKLKTILPKLNEKELYILQNRLLTDDPVTLREIGERYNVTRERVRQLEARLLEKIRQHLALDIKDFSDAWIQ